jgi:pimeloyl-ACP methyl ester carboxylesterase
VARGIEAGAQQTLSEDRERSSVTNRAIARGLISCAVLLAACSTPTPPALDAGADASAGDAGASDAVAAEDSAVEDASADGGGAARDITVAPAMNPRVIEPGVVRSVARVAVSAPPANTVMGRAPVPTPTELNFVQVLQYRAEGTEPGSARSVIVAVPGFLGGAGSFDGLARALVKRGAREGRSVEVWAIDRRSNLLEDLAGMDAAEAMDDPELARLYYVSRSISVNGRRFAGHPTANGASLAYMSEWGLPMLVGDIRAVINSVGRGKQRVTLMGHSLGGSIVEAYSSWRFADDMRGYDTIAGLAVVDGVAGGTSVTEAQYLNGGAPAPGGFGMAQGITMLRASGPYFVALPLLGVQAVVLAEIVARRALKAPEAVVTDARRDELLRTLLSLDRVPPLTNAAAMGFAFDADSCALSFAAMNIGRPVGPTTRVASVLGPMITAPSDPMTTYRWTDAPMSAPPEFTPMRSAALGWAASPSNFSEWYFPARLTLDVSVLGDMRIAEGSFAWREGVRASLGGQVDVPVLAIGTGLVRERARFDAMVPRLSATVGAGRPNAGAARTDDRGFRVLMLPEMSHIDPIMAPESSAPANPVPAALLDFASANTAM